MVKLNIEIPEKFLEGETRDGHYITPEMKKIWAVMFDLLFEFKRVCDKYNLRWWADAGTLLGAVRHKGIIPWDDDLDVVMMREDYEKLREIAPTEFKHPYFYQTFYSDHDSIRGSSALRNSNTTCILTDQENLNLQYNQGIFLDIMPLDAIPDDENTFSQQINNICKYRLAMRKAYGRKYLKMYFYKEKYSFIEKIKGYILHYLTIDPIGKLGFSHICKFKKFDIECQKYNNTKTQRICKIVYKGDTFPRRIWEKSWFDETVYLPFEWFEVPAPKGYEKLLENFYGDWHIMKKGAASHKGFFFDVDKPYTEYIK